MRRLLVLFFLLLPACGRKQPSYERQLDLGYQALQRGELRAARARAEAGLSRARAMRDATWQGRFRVLEAEVLVGESRPSEALALLGDQAQGPDSADVRAMMTRGFARCLAGGGGSFGRAASDLAEAGRRAAELRSSELAAEVSFRSGMCALFEGDLAAAERRIRDAFSTGQRQQLPFLEAKAAASLGFLRVRAGRYDAAVDWLTRAIALASSHGADLLLVKTLTNLGWCYYQLGDYERALGYHARAESLAEARGYAGERQIALQNIGNAHYRQADLAAAGDDYHRALALARELRNRKAIAELLSNLGYVALERGDYDRAEGFVREALAIKAELADLPAQQHSLLAEGQIWAGRGETSRAESCYRSVLGSAQAGPELLWETRASLARLLIKGGRNAEAEAEFHSAFAIMESSRAELHQAEHRISFFSSLDEFYDDYVDFLVATGRTEWALDVADRGRARLLRETLQHEGALPTATGVRFQAAARALDGVILFYSLAPSRSFLWALTPRGVLFRVLPGEAEIRTHVEAHQRRVLQARDPLEESDSDAGWLFQALVGPVAGAIRPGSRVAFIPDGPLYQLNPETLVVSSPTPHYWIEDVALLTAPSLSLLAAPRARPATPKPEARSILLVGDPLPAGEEFPRLAQAEREMTRIADQFEPAQRTLYSGARAVPSAYGASKPGRFAFIHFAAHAQASREVPLESAVILTTEKETGKLYARDIVKLPLRAELVTLSACRSAGSRTFAGEGLVGLGWAFLSAGAGNVVAGLWNVEDSSTSELMAQLYGGVRQGLAPAEALRQAKLRLLRSQTAYRKPFYWAPFMIYTRSPEPTGRERPTGPRVRREGAGGGEGRSPRVAPRARASASASR